MLVSSHAMPMPLDASIISETEVPKLRTDQESINAPNVTGPGKN